MTFEKCCSMIHSQAGRRFLRFTVQYSNCMVSPQRHSIMPAWSVPNTKQHPQSRRLYKTPRTPTSNYLAVLGEFASHSCMAIRPHFSLAFRISMHNQKAARAKWTNNTYKKTPATPTGSGSGEQASEKNQCGFILIHAWGHSIGPRPLDLT